MRPSGVSRLHHMRAMTREERMARLLELRRRLLSSGGDEDEQILTELESMSNHPDPLGLLLNMEEYTQEEFEELMFAYQTTVLPYHHS